MASSGAARLYHVGPPFELSQQATDHLTATLAGAPGMVVVTSATIMPSRRLTHILQVDSLDDPERLRLLAQETAAGTVVSGSYFRSGGRISFQAEITDANDGRLLEAVGPVTSPVDRSGDAMDYLGRGLEAAIRRLTLTPPWRSGGRKASARRPTLRT